MLNIKLDHCVIHVSDWERSNKFYCEVMGTETAPVGSGWAYRFGGTQLNCHGPNVVRYTCSKNTCNAWWQ